MSVLGSIFFSFLLANFILGLTEFLIHKYSEDV